MATNNEYANVDDKDLNMIRNNLKDHLKKVEDELGVRERNNEDVCTTSLPQGVLTPDVDGLALSPELKEEGEVKNNSPVDNVRAPAPVKNKKAENADVANKIECECGGKFAKRNKNKHDATAKHLAYLDKKQLVKNENTPTTVILNEDMKG